MAFGTGGTFSSDAKNIGMSFSDIQQLQEKLSFKGDKGFVPYQFKGKNYKVQYAKSGGDITLLSIQTV
jgi:hypothetical protein